MRGGRIRVHVIVRVVVAVTTMASVLVPALVAPARTISVPATLARSSTFAADRASIKPAFQPTHVAFSWTGPEGTGIRFRTVSADGEMSAWQKATEAHDLEAGRRHFSGVQVVDRPGFIEWQAIEPAGMEVHGVKLDYINTLDGPRRTMRVPAVAGAAASDPTIVTRAQWGADESLKRTSGGCKRHFYRVQQLFVHHTAGKNFDPHPAATMRAIYWYHTRSRGWCDLGYNFVVGPDGRIFEGRWARRYGPWEIHSSETRDGRAVAGAHVSSFNSGSVGISLMGNFTNVAPTPAARRALAELLAWEVDRHGLRARGKHTYRNPETGRTKWLPYIAGHRDAGQTSCPGGVLYKRLWQIRRDTKTVMGEGKPTSSISMTASARKITFGDAVTLSGTLVDNTAAPLASKTVHVYRRAAGRDWVRHAALTTGVDGSFSFDLSPNRNVVVAAVFEGDEGFWGAQTPNVKVKVRHLVSLVPEGGTLDPFGTYQFPTGTESVLLVGDVKPRHPGEVARLKIYRREPDDTTTLLQKVELTLDSSSAYGYQFTVPGPGTYEAITWMRRDQFHAVGHSPPARIFIP